MQPWDEHPRLTSVSDLRNPGRAPVLQWQPQQQQQQQQQSQQSQQWLQWYHWQPRQHRPWQKQPFDPYEASYISVSIWDDGELELVQKMQLDHQHNMVFATCCSLPPRFASYPEDEKAQIRRRRSVVAALSCVHIMGGRMVHSGFLPLYEADALKMGYTFTLASHIDPRFFEQSDACPRLQALVAALNMHPTDQQPGSEAVRASIAAQGREHDTYDGLMPIDPALMLVDNHGAFSACDPCDPCDPCAQCPICIEPFATGKAAAALDTPFRTRCCDKLMHLGCAMSMVNRQPSLPASSSLSCPLCRGDMSCE